jgi:alkaline phosphatase isozyme conversion protein
MHYITKKISTICMAIFFCSSVLTFSGCNKESTTDPTLIVGNEGFQFAIKLSQTLPYRKAYTEHEQAAAQLIIDELESFGYNPLMSVFGDSVSSQNIIIQIPGTGFMVPSEETPDTNIPVRRQVIIGAHYDTFIGLEDASKYPNFNGIQDNSSGVGALISLAKEITSTQYEYDIILVFFGAGHDDFAGARHFTSLMTPDEISNTDVMYCIESIYAGDKLYAHAGMNSLEQGMKYLRRRKLYEISDVAISNRIDLRFNVSDLDVKLTGNSDTVVYREITTTESDYIVFDQIGIPCVFLESYDYFASSVTEQVESKNPVFSSTKGKIRRTNFDSYEYLGDVFEEERLEIRIKNTAFLIIKAIARGIYQ